MIDRAADINITHFDQFGQLSKYGATISVALDVLLDKESYNKLSSAIMALVVSIPKEIEALVFSHYYEYQELKLAIKAFNRFYEDLLANGEKNEIERSKAKAHIRNFLQAQKVD